MIRNISRKHRPNGAAAEGGPPIGGAAEGGASVFFVLLHVFASYNIYYLSYIPNILYVPYIPLYNSLYSL